MRGRARTRENYFLNRYHHQMQFPSKEKISATTIITPKLGLHPIEDVVSHRWSLVVWLKVLLRKGGSP